MSDMDDFNAGVIAEGQGPTPELTARLLTSPSMTGLALASRATVRDRREEGEGTHVVAYDYGMKRNIVRMLVRAGCRVTVVPADTSAAQVREPVHGTRRERWRGYEKHLQPLIDALGGHAEIERLHREFT